MLKVYRGYKLRDHLRTCQGLRSYGLQIAPNNRAIQWHGAKITIEGTIIYFIARQIDNNNHVIANYDIAVDRIKVENGQYLYDNTKIFDGILPNGVFFFEFADGYDIFYSEIFGVKYIQMLMTCSGTWNCSGSFGISDTNVNNPNQIILKRFEENELYEFED